MTNPNLDDVKGLVLSDDVKALADELDVALDGYLNSLSPSAAHLNGNALRQILWDNKAGIISTLRLASQREEVGQTRIADGGHKPEQAGHRLSDLEYVELIRKWRDIGFNAALETAHMFVDDGVLAVIAALEDMKTMLPPLPSKGN